MITVKLEGWDQLKAQLKQLPNRINKQILRTAIQRAAVKVANIAKQTAQFRDRTGALRKSIKAVRRRGSSTSVESTVGSKYYGLFIERGYQYKTKTGIKHMPAKPFLVPALEQNREKIMTDITNEIKLLLAKKLTELKNK